MMVPAKRPQWTRERVLDAIRHFDLRDSDHVIVVGVRGYYRDSMGKPGENDRAIYDDAIFVITPSEFRSFNANVDPSKHQVSVASLKVGVYRYKPGPHGVTFNRPGYPYPAFIQASEVVVKRDGKKGDFTGWFGINIHRGGLHSTSSLGCQTIPPNQWKEFHHFLNAALKANSQGTFPYVLIEGQG
jgi:lysozyme